MFGTQSATKTFGIYYIAVFVVLKRVLGIFDIQSATKTLGLYQLVEFVVLKMSFINLFTFSQQLKHL